MGLPFHPAPSPPITIGIIRLKQSLPLAGLVLLQWMRA
jgi:hypothetical protein